MANLRANKITGTEVFETTGSVQFDGSGDALTVPAGTDFAYGTGDFTVEAWVYQASSTGFQVLFAQTVGGTNYFVFASNSGVPTLYSTLSGGGDAGAATGSTISATTWNHIAVTRQSGTVRVFVNGIAGTSVTNTTDLTNTSYVPTIGDYTHGGFANGWNGHISNLRILKGTALYTKNFTPPTRELTVIPNTVLLACQSTTRANEEKTGKTITVNGNAVANELTPGLLTDRVKSGGTSAITGSVEFSGGVTGLTLNSSDFAFGTGDFCVEGWFNVTDSSSIRSIFDTRTSDNLSTGFFIGINSSDEFYTYGFPAGIGVSNWMIPTPGQWNHFAVTRQSNTGRVFINGVSVGVVNMGSTDYTQVGGTVGRPSTVFGSLYGFQGFISNLRVLKGTALYTGSFIPPTRELKRLPNTVLLCCKNSSDPAAEETGKIITVNGNATARNFSPQVGFDGTVTFDGVTKINTPNYFYLPTGNTEDRGRGRGVFGGGFGLIGGVNTIDYITISSTGNASDFGDLTQSRWGPSACSSHTRGVFGGGYTPPAQLNTIDYITISSTGNANDFGDLTQSRYAPSSCSSSTRGVFGGGGYPSVFNTIDYITISSTGNASDFGDLTQIRRGLSSCSSSTRGVFGGGYSPTLLNTIDYITISSTGNANDFGDLTQSRYAPSSCSSSTRGVFGGGALSVSSSVNTIDYITISSTGNSSDFGDLILIRQSAGSCSSSIRGVFGGGRDPDTNTIDYVNISSTGNASDFGDLTQVRHWVSACSDSHGGLG
jgi:hypothetical protein